MNDQNKIALEAQSLNDEWHARPGLRVLSGQRCVHIVTARNARLLERAGLAPHEGFTAPHAKYYIANMDAFSVKWEGHTEVSSYTFLTLNETQDDDALSFLPASAQEDFLSHSHLGVRVDFLDVAKTQKLGIFKEAKIQLGRQNLYGGLMSDGHAAVWSSFKLDTDGFLRILVVDISLTDGRRSRLVQRLLDIETYRFLAIKALPVARHTMEQLDALEPELDYVMATLANESNSHQETLLRKITRIAARAEQLGSSTAYRFAAAKAYADIVDRRTTEVREGIFENHLRMSVFLDKSFRPAMRTCDAAKQRAGDLTARVARAITLLNTMIDMEQKRQNNEILRSMERQASTQVKLQQSVEGFSVFAISYYAVGLISYSLKGLKSAGLQFPNDVVSGLIVPIVLGFSWVTIRFVKRRVAKG